MADWVRIRSEYITTDTSYRKLSAKFDISYSVLAERASKEHWTEQRNQFRRSVTAKTLNKVCSAEMAIRIRILDLADKLLVMLDKAIDELDLVVTTHKVKTKSGNAEELVEYKTVTRGGCVDITGLRQLMSALKDLKSIIGVVSDLDREEREARIASLRRQSMSADHDNGETGVILVTFKHESDD